MASKECDLQLDRKLSSSSYFLQKRNFEKIMKKRLVFPQKILSTKYHSFFESRKREEQYCDLIPLIK